MNKGQPGRDASHLEIRQWGVRSTGQLESKTGSTVIQTGLLSALPKLYPEVCTNTHRE